MFSKLEKAMKIWNLWVSLTMAIFFNGHENWKVFQHWTLFSTQIVKDGLAYHTCKRSSFCQLRNGIFGILRCSHKQEQNHEETPQETIQGYIRLTTLRLGKFKFSPLNSPVPLKPLIPQESWRKMLSEGYHTLWNTFNVATKFLAQRKKPQFFLSLKQPI